MWIFTQYGFFSAVCARQGMGKISEDVDRDRIMIRGRVRSHLEALQKRFPDLLGNSLIEASFKSDYAFRIFVTKPIWVQVTSALAEETDYDNFKSAVSHYQGRAGSAYERSLHRVWETMHDLQLFDRGSDENS